jgi:signal peptidase I
MLDDGVSGRHRVPHDPVTAHSTDMGSTPNGTPRGSEGRDQTPASEPAAPTAPTADADSDASREPFRPPAPNEPDAGRSRPGPTPPATTGPAAARDEPDHIDEVPTPAGSSTRRARRRKAKTAKQRRKAPWWELPALVLLAILIAIGVKTFVVQPFYIPSQSMEKTLHGCPGCRGDRILVNKPIYDLRDPNPGDIVVFHAPSGWDDEPVSRPPSNPLLRAVRGFGQLVGFVPPDGQVLVKRVIATSGQTVKGDSSGRVQVSTDGPKGPFRTLHEPYVFIDNGQNHSMRSFGPVTVPKGRLWVMGDHRNDSADSRYHCGPGGTDSGNDTNCNLFAKEATVPVDDVIGKAFLIAWPPSRWRTLGTPATFESAAATITPAVPVATSTALVLPLYVVRRRRRR